MKIGWYAKLACAEAELFWWFPEDARKKGLLWHGWGTVQAKLIQQRTSVSHGWQRQAHFAPQMAAREICNFAITWKCGDCGSGSVSTCANDPQQPTIYLNRWWNWRIRTWAELMARSTCCYSTAVSTSGNSLVWNAEVHSAGSVQKIVLEFHYDDLLETSSREFPCFHTLLPPPKSWRH